MAREKISKEQRKINKNLSNDWLDQIKKYDPHCTQKTIAKLTGLAESSISESKETGALIEHLIQLKNVYEKIDTKGKTPAEIERHHLKIKNLAAIIVGDILRKTRIKTEIEAFEIVTLSKNEGLFFTCASSHLRLLTMLDVLIENAALDQLDIVVSAQNKMQINECVRIWLAQKYRNVSINLWEAPTLTNVEIFSNDIFAYAYDDEKAIYAELSQDCVTQMMIAMAMITNENNVLCIPRSPEKRLIESFDYENMTLPIEDQIPAAVIDFMYDQVESYEQANTQTECSDKSLKRLFNDVEEKVAITFGPSQIRHGLFDTFRLKQV
jgi:hypothetical protein